VFRLGNVGFSPGPGSDSPHAGISGSGRSVFGASAIARQADIRAMATPMRRVLAAPFQVLPDSFAAAVASRFYDFAQLLDARLRDRAVDALNSFRGQLASETMAATGRFPRLGEHPDVSFALEEIGPARVEAAKRCLAAEDERDYNALITFLDGLGEGVRYDLTHAEDENDVGDTLLRALDNLHDFLLAHKLVSTAYNAAQSSGEGFMFRVAELTERRSRILQLFAVSSTWPSASRWSPSRLELSEIGRREFTRDQPKKTVTVA
jgi:hypothetical protein